MKQLSAEEAKKYYESERWKDLTPAQLAKFQIQQPLLTVPWNVFQKAVSDVLERPVLTHEFSEPEILVQELRTKDWPEITDQLIFGEE